MRVNYLTRAKLKNKYIFTNRYHKYQKYTTLFPLKFAPLKLKGASSRSTKARKLKGEEKMPRMNEKTSNLQ